MKFLNAAKIAGVTSRIIETRFYYIINGALYDKATMTPRTLQFLEGVQGCTAVPNTLKWISQIGALDGIFENQSSSFMVDSVDPTITYIPVNEFHTSVAGAYGKTRILKVKETATDFTILAMVDTVVAGATQGFIREFVSQSADYIFALCGSSTTNKVYLVRFLKADLSLSLLMRDVGASTQFDYVGENGDEMIFMMTLPSTAAGKWTLVQYNKLNGTASSVAVLTGYTSALNCYPTAPKKVSDGIYTQYRAAISPTSPFNLVISKNTYDMSKVGVSAVATILASKVDLASNVNLLPNSVSAAIKLYEVTGADGTQYLVMSYYQSGVATALAYGQLYVWSINADTGALTYIGTSGQSSTSIVRGIIPISNGRVMVMLTASSACFMTFNETTKQYVKTKEIATSPFSVGVDEFENVYITNADWSVTKLNATMPVDVNLKFATPLDTYAGTNLLNNIVVNAYNSSGKRIATSMKLVIDGANAMWTDNSQGTVTVTTSATEDVLVPITITKGGTLVIRPTIV